MKLKCTCCYNIKIRNKHCEHCLLYTGKNNNIHDLIEVKAGLVDKDKIPTLKRVIEKSMINMLRVKSGLKHFAMSIEFEIDGKLETKFIKV